MRVYFRDFFKFFSIVLARNNALIFSLAITQILVGIMPAVLLYLIAQAVASISDMGNYIYIVIALGCVILLSELTEVLEYIISSVLSDTTKKNLKSILIKKSAMPPSMDHFSSAEFQDVFFLTEQNISDMSDFVAECSILLTGVLGLLSIGVLLTNLQWWIPIALIIGIMPIVYFKCQLERKIWGIEEEHSKEFKLLSLTYEGLTRSDSAKELRLNKHANLLKERWGNIYSAILRKIHREKFNGLLKLSLYSLPSVILIIAILYHVGVMFSEHKYETSQLVILFGAILQIRTQLVVVVAYLSSVSKTFFSSKAVLKLIDFNVDIADQRIFDAGNTKILSIKNVSFRYPGCESYVFKNLSFDVDRNTLTVLTAPNGAGKSTLINLVAGLYRQYEGEIKLGCSDGFKVWGVNQNFNLPSVTVKDFLDPYNVHDDNVIKEKLKHFQLGHLVDKIPFYLDSRFENYVELSGGQWQRLALVKVDLHYQDCDLIILDELNSALDKDGDILYQNLLLKIKGHTSIIIISHKPEIHKYCDNVVSII